MFCFNRISAFCMSNSIVKTLMNNKLKAQTLTGNPTGNLRCHVLASRVLNSSCSFGQSARSIGSRGVVKDSTSIYLMQYQWYYSESSRANVYINIYPDAEIILFRSFSFYFTSVSYLYVYIQILRWYDSEALPLTSNAFLACAYIFWLWRSYTLYCCISAHFLEI